MVQGNPLVVANWKMHGTIEQVKVFAAALCAHEAEYIGVDTVFMPAAIHLMLAAEVLRPTTVLLGAQDLYWGEYGAVTGAISGPMLAEAGCRYVLIGHSERRRWFHEDADCLRHKLQAVLAAKLQPIFCIGETAEERQHGQTQAVLSTQLEPLLSVYSQANIAQAERALVVAYEPVWAIGSGVAASADDAQVVSAGIRTYCTQNHFALANGMRILYGGSLTANNAATLFNMPDIDGGLVGGAALQADSFLAICTAARVKL